MRSGCIEWHSKQRPLMTAGPPYDLQSPRVKLTQVINFYPTGPDHWRWEPFFSPDCLIWKGGEQNQTRWHSLHGTNLVSIFSYLSPSEHDVILRIHHCCACSFLFGWPPCQRSDMTLEEVSQHAYNYLFIRTIVLFVFLRNSCEPDMVLV